HIRVRNIKWIIKQYSWITARPEILNSKGWNSRVEIIDVKLMRLTLNPNNRITILCESQINLDNITKTKINQLYLIDVVCSLVIDLRKQLLRFNDTSTPNTSKQALRWILQLNRTNLSVGQIVERDRIRPLMC